MVYFEMLKDRAASLNNGMEFSIEIHYKDEKKKITTKQTLTIQHSMKAEELAIFLKSVRLQVKFEEQMDKIRTLDRLFDEIWPDSPIISISDHIRKIQEKAGKTIYRYTPRYHEDWKYTPDGRKEYLKTLAETPS